MWKCGGRFVFNRSTFQAVQERHVDMKMSKKCALSAHKDQNQAQRQIALPPGPLLPRRKGFSVQCDKCMFVACVPSIFSQEGSLFPSSGTANSYPAELPYCSHWSVKHTDMALLSSNFKTFKAFYLPAPI